MIFKSLNITRFKSMINNLVCRTNHQNYKSTTCDKYGCSKCFNCDKLLSCNKFVLGVVTGGSLGYYFCYRYFSKLYN